MEKFVKYTYNGARKDITKSKHPVEFYFEASHIRIVSLDDQSTGSVINEKGNSKVIEIPSININASTNTISYGSKTLSYTNNNQLDKQIDNNELNTSSSDQIVIGHAITRTGILLFTTDDEGMDCIWNVDNVIDNSYDLELIYLRNMSFSTSNPIQALFNYENENIQKVYWVDGINQIRFINIKHNEIEDNDDLIDIPSTSIDFVGTVDFSQPIVTDVITGGSHTAGMIQYAYNLYRLNSSQTKLSPLSELVSLDKGDNNGGGDVDEVVGSTPVITIDNIDQSYTNIKVYAIKYTSYNQIPSISLIDERELSGDSLTIYDNGSVIDTLSLEEFVFLGSDPIVPKHIQSKDNRLFPTNIKDIPFVLPDELDTRAYSWSSSQTCSVYDNIKLLSGVVTGSRRAVSSVTYSLPLKHDAVNINYDLYKYQQNGFNLGAEGKFIKLEIVQKSLSKPEEYKLLKDEEIYRFGIEFYNSLGQTSLPKWIVDYKMPKGNLEGNFNTVKVELKPEFYTWLNNYNFTENNKPVGYRIIRAERNESDKTIVCQGVLTPMMFQVLGDDAKFNSQFSSLLIREGYQDSKVKYPNFLSREFQSVPASPSANDQGSTNNGVLQPSSHLNWMNDDEGLDSSHGGEIFTTTPNDKLSQTFQHTKMMQLYCPEIIFQNNLNITADLKLKVKGLVKSTANGVYAEERFVVTQLEKNGGRTLGGINPWWVLDNQYIDNNNFRDCYNVPERSAGNFDRAFIGPSGDNSTMNFKQYYRAYNDYVNDTTNLEYAIYGRPEISTRGDDRTFYNNNTNYEYKNSLSGFVVDGDNECQECSPITSINSFNADCMTLVLGNSTQTTNSRKSLEDLYDDSSLSDPNGMLLVEIKKDDVDVYTSEIYGGLTYEDKKRTSYIPIGSYNDVNINSVQIDNPGDTFVQKFTFLRINKTDTEVYSTTQSQITEIVEYYTETSIDLKNRNDISLNEWDSRFQPRFDNYHKYNTVYSQQNNLLSTNDTSFTFRRIENFDTRIQTTQLKIPNETIDSWTDILQNEQMDLDGKFGPINNIIEFKDNLYTFQDEAIAMIRINPKIQVSASEGAAIELGTGGILYDYDYLTTKSGSINKWGIVPTKKGIYYYDVLNKGIGRVPDATVNLLSDIKYHHSYFNKNYDYDMIKVDNPVLNKGAVFGYDNYNNDVYFTLLQGDKSFTYCYNELIDEFVDIKSYNPNRYIYKGDKLLLSNDNETLYESFAGEYNNFFGEYSPSYIILQVNPESKTDVVYNNIIYNSEIYLDDIDQPDKTLTHIQAYNEYQDSGRIPLILGRSSNLRRKFRQWKANIPREGRSRMRNSWIFLKLELDNESNYKMILHDIIISYTV